MRGSEARGRRAGMERSPSEHPPVCVRRFRIVPDVPHPTLGRKWHAAPPANGASSAQQKPLGRTEQRVSSPIPTQKLLISHKTHLDIGHHRPRELLATSPSRPSTNARAGRMRSSRLLAELTRVPLPFTLALLAAFVSPGMIPSRSPLRPLSGRACRCSMRPSVEPSERRRMEQR